MRESLNRAGKVVFMVFLGLIVLVSTHVMPGTGRQRAMERLVLDALRSISAGAPVGEKFETSGGRSMWLETETGNIIVRDSVTGYQSVLDLLFRFDGNLDLDSFRLILGSGGTFAQRTLESGDLDALSGATITENAIRTAVSRIQRDLERSLGLGR